MPTDKMYACEMRKTRENFDFDYYIGELDGTPMYNRVPKGSPNPMGGYPLKPYLRQVSEFIKDTLDQITEGY